MGFTYNNTFYRTDDTHEITLLSDWCYNYVTVGKPFWGSPNAMPVLASTYKRGPYRV